MARQKKYPDIDHYFADGLSNSQIIQATGMPKDIVSKRKKFWLEENPIDFTADALPFAENDAVAIKTPFDNLNGLMMDHAELKIKNDQKAERLREKILDELDRTNFHATYTNMKTSDKVFIASIMKG
jgi:hypothetical protein